MLYVQSGLSCRCNPYVCVSYKTVQIVYIDTKLATSMSCNYNSWHSSQCFTDCMLSSALMVTYVNILLYWFYSFCNPNDFYNFSKVEGLDFLKMMWVYQNM